MIRELNGPYLTVQTSVWTQICNNLALSIRILNKLENLVESHPRGKTLIFNKKK